MSPFSAANVFGGMLNYHYRDAALKKGFFILHHTGQ
jgi:hypothetical protein